MLSMESERDVQMLIQTSFIDGGPAISPNGEWIAYNTDESGRMEVYVQRFPDLSGRQRISTDGGRMPRGHQTGTNFSIGVWMATKC